MGKEFKQGRSGAEENSSAGCFRRRGNERSKAIGTAAPDVTPCAPPKSQKRINL
ncbi:MAG: hypothetical protein IKN72_10075 [Clostridia bacterium]|nr:hypothetical protein [Clostridia bacterium]